MARRLLLLALLFLTGCGGGDSYTEKALEEYRVGNGADFRQARKKPAAKEVTAWQKKMKKVAAGSKDDFDCPSDLAVPRWLR